MRSWDCYKTRREGERKRMLLETQMYGCRKNLTEVQETTNVYIFHIIYNDEYYQVWSINGFIIS